MDILPSNPGKVATYKRPYGPPLKGGVFLNPWADAGRDDFTGQWLLPQYPCEINNLDQYDPKNHPWNPGDWEDGVDNMPTPGTEDRFRNASKGTITHWGGQKLWDGDDPPRDWDPERLPEEVQRLLKVPHMPGQPVKEYFARLRALEPRFFTDKDFADIMRNLPEDYYKYVRQVKWFEGFGIATAIKPAEWESQLLECVPAAYVTPRDDVVQICVGIAEDGPRFQNKLEDEQLAAMILYDDLEFLYAKDQEGKIIQIAKYEPQGLTKIRYATFSFIPPKGTFTITPHAIFRIRGAWAGQPISWDPSIENEAMQWFTDMKPEQRKELCDPSLLDSRAASSIERLQYPKRTKQELKLLPENTWEGNAAKARNWDEMNQ